MNKKIFTIVYFTRFEVSEALMKKVLANVDKPAMPRSGGVYMACKETVDGQETYKVYVMEADGPSGVLLRGADKKEGHFTYELVELNKVNILDYELEGEQYVAISRWLKGEIGEFSGIMGNSYIEFDGFDNQHAELQTTPERVDYEQEEECICATCRPELHESPRESNDEEAEEYEYAHDEYEEAELIVVGEEEIKSMEALFLIRQKDDAMANVLSGVLEYIASTYGEKYAEADLNTRGIIESLRHGKGFNIGNSSKYLSRYLTEGFSKSDNPVDVLKSIHYNTMELVRRQKHNL